MSTTETSKDITRRDGAFSTDMTPEQRRIWIKAIVARMMQAWGLKNKKLLAEMLSIHPKAPSNWIQNGSVPWGAVLACSNRTGKSLDWLYFGREPVAVLTATAKQQLFVRLEAFLRLSCKTKQIREANDNGIVSLADGLADDIEIFLEQFASVGHKDKPDWWQE